MTSIKELKKALTIICLIVIAAAASASIVTIAYGEGGGSLGVCWCPDMATTCAEVDCDAYDGGPDNWECGLDSNGYCNPNKSPGIVKCHCIKWIGGNPIEFDITGAVCTYELYVEWCLES